MKLILLISLFVCATTLVYAQTKDTPLDELLEMKTYLNDQSAEAVVIYDIGETVFDDNDRGIFAYFKRKCRLKILTTAGLKFAEIAVPLYVKEFENEELIDFTTTTYNVVEGTRQTTKANKKDLMVEKINENWIQKKIAIPGAKVGSVIDFEYRLSSPFLFNIQDWEFQHEIPVIYSEYVTKMIPFYTYAYLAKGTPKFDEFTTYKSPGLPRRMGSVEFNEMIYKFVMKDIPAFRDFDFISSPADYKIKIDFQLSEVNRLDGSKEQIITTWPKMITDLNKSNTFGKYIKACNSESKKVLKTKFPQPTNTIETLKKLVSYVKRNYNWDEGKGMYAQKTAKDFFKQRSGNTGNINLYLTSLLQQAGMNAAPVILSTRDHGRIYAEYPFAHFFNYVVVQCEIDGKTYLIDATDKLATFDQLPDRCINDKGLVVKAKELKWAILTPKTTSGEMHSFFYTLNTTNDSLNCSFTYTATEYDGLKQKRKYLADSVAYTSNKLETSFDKVENIKTVATDSIKLFALSCNGKVQPTKIDNFITLKPFLNFAMEENPFNKKNRIHNIDLIYPQQKHYEATFLLPENAKLIVKPETISINNDDYGMNYNITYADNILRVESNYKLKKSVYEPEMYLKLQSLFDKIIKMTNQEIQIQL